MTNCRCAKCRRREIYSAIEMTLSLAWSKWLNGSCHIEKLANNTERHRPDNSDVLSKRVLAAEKVSRANEIKSGIQTRMAMAAQNAGYINSVERTHAKDILELAKIAARTDQDGRNEGLSDLRIEKLIVRAKEILSADSASSQLAQLPDNLELTSAETADDISNHSYLHNVTRLSVYPNRTVLPS
jgi:hypothetical protein